MKAHLNESLGSYVPRLRLDQGAMLLRYSKEPVNQIVFFCGYETPAAFNKAYKRRFAVSPLEFRNEKGNFSAEGTYTGFDGAYTQIYAKWLPESGLQLRNEPGFEKYLNNPGKTKPENLLTEIYIPVE